jgi:predicted flap endonuclease-1-like 5' DNA nuclease
MRRRPDPRSTNRVLTILVIAFAVIAFGVGYAFGRSKSAPAAPLAPTPVAATPAVVEAPSPRPVADDRANAERARIIRSYESEASALRRALSTSQAETARYRQLAIDIENNAPPPLFGPGAPDDLKLIVGVGPVLERMLHQLGVTTFRQIANWTERDIDEIDAKLPEFPGRIRRDTWVTQARALHQSKYGEALPPPR